MWGATHTPWLYGQACNLGFDIKSDICTCHSDLREGRRIQWASQHEPKTFCLCYQWRRAFYLQGCSTRGKSAWIQVATLPPHRSPDWGQCQAEREGNTQVLMTLFAHRSPAPPDAILGLLQFEWSACHWWLRGQNKVILLATSLNIISLEKIIGSVVGFCLFCVEFINYWL